MTDPPVVPAAEIRSAQADDVDVVSAFLQPFVDDKRVLARSRSELMKLIENGFIAEAGGPIVGFAAVEAYSRKLAELQCLAVAEPHRRRGIGLLLIRCCIRRARELGIYELMTITSAEEPFRQCGFDYALPEQKRALFVHPQQLGDPQ